MLPDLLTQFSIDFSSIYFVTVEEKRSSAFCAEEEMDRYLNKKKKRRDEWNTQRLALSSVKQISLQIWVFLRENLLVSRNSHFQHLFLSWFFRENVQNHFVEVEESFDIL